MAVEIERKFFCDAARLGRPVGSLHLEQGYLGDTGATEVRLRRSSSGQHLTIKSGAGTRRFEWEIDVPALEFESLWTHAERRVSKIRQQHAWKGHTLEVDFYERELEGLVTAEVEFSSLAEARSFVLPRAFGAELTWDPRFKNRALAGDPSVPLAVGKGPWSYGVLPYQHSGHGLELIAVTTRRHDRWIVPKGQPEPGRTPEQVALLEAHEEAGLTGRITGHALVLPYPRETGSTNLLLYPMLVTRMAPRWLESSQRERKVIGLAEAADYGEVVRLGARVLLEMIGTVGSENT